MIHIPHVARLPSRSFSLAIFTASVLLYLLLTWLYSADAPTKYGRSSQRHSLDVGPNVSVCDPHELPGTLYVAEDYDNREAALQTLWHSISSAPECSPQSFVQGLARNDASVLAHLPHNRTILLVGDSIDRNNIQYACYLLQGEHGIVLPDTPLWPQPEISITNPGPNSWQPNEYSARSFPTSCHIASIDLMIVNVFHFGLDEDTYFGWKDQYGPPYKTEDRIRQIALPLADKLQRSIDIVEFGAGLWDLARFGRIDDEAGADAGVPLRHLSLDRLSWYAERCASMLELIGKLFPTSGLYVRKLHIPTEDDPQAFSQWWKSSGKGNVWYFSSWRLNELNSALLQALRMDKTQRWRLDTWGDKLFGMDVYAKGDIHPHYTCTTLWLEQMLFRLYKSERQDSALKAQ